MENSTVSLQFTELEPMDAPDDGWDWFRGLSYGVALGVIALAAT